MKKIFALICAVGMVMAFAACGNNSGSAATATEPKEVSIDTAALAGDLKSKVTYPDPLYPLDASMLNTLLAPDTVPEGTESTVYMDSVSNIRFGVFTCTSEDNAKALYTTLQGFVARQITTFGDYMPNEVELLKHAVLEQDGKYVVICVTGDYENAKTIIDGYCK